MWSEGASTQLEAGATYEPPSTPGYPDTGASCRGSLNDREAELSERSSLGFSGSEVLDLFNALAHGELTWADGGTTQVDFVATPTDGRVTYADPPKDAEFCTPGMQVPLDVLSIRTSDGIVDARVVPSDERPLLYLAAESDGRGGIGLIFPSGLWVDPADVDSPAVDEAAAAHPEHELRGLDFRFSLSASEHKSACLHGQVVSGDANERCNIFDGVVLYSSRFADIELGPSVTKPLGTWFWTK
ncbi:MAG: hypothetical protein ABW321_11405 [Polyangiales bacterium]